MKFKVTIPGDAPPWAGKLESDLNSIFTRLGPLLQKTPTFPKARLPLDGSANVAIVPDEVGGLTLAFFDPTTKEWRRAQDRALVA